MAPHSWSKRRPRLRRGYVWNCVAVLAALLAAPGACAIDLQVHEAIRGAGEGRLLGPLDAARLDVARFTQPKDVLFAHGLTVTAWQAWSAGNDVYTHTVHKPLGVWHFRDATVALVGPGPEPRLLVVDNGTTEARLAAASTFVMRPGGLPQSTGSVNGDANDPNDRFRTHAPNSLKLVQDEPELDLRGDFAIRLSDLTFRVRHDATATDFRAAVQRVADPTGNLRTTNETFFIIDAAGGTFAPGPYARAIEAFLPEITVDVAGRVEVLGPEPVDLRGAVHGVALGTAPDVLRLSYRVTGAAPLHPAQASPGRMASAAPWISSLVLGAAFGGAATWRVRRHERLTGGGAAAGAHTPAAATAPPTAPLAASEGAFRRDPSNLALGLDLGLRYLAADRPSDALPLLLMSTQAFPKAEVARYHAALALLAVDRVAEAVSHLNYSFRLNPLNVARFLKEGPAARHGRHPLVRELLERWARAYRDTNHRGYA